MEDNIKNKPKIGLPLLALSLDAFPVLIIFLGQFLNAFSAFVLLLLVMSPIAGVILGVVSLNRGKTQIGMAGKVIAIIAIVIPTAIATLFISFLIGAETGLISLM